MTAEIVAMNKEAVALAADSAVTVAGKKVFTTAEKLFMLARGHQVGVMIYNNAEFMGMPWSVLITRFGDTLPPAPLPRLEAYVTAFYTFMREQGSTIFPADHQRHHFRTLIDGLMRQLTRSIWMALQARSHELLDEDAITRLVAGVVQQAYDERVAMDSDVEDAESIHACLLARYGEMIEDRRSVWFDQLPLQAAQRQQIQVMCLLLVTSISTLRSYTGMVFAGFGADENYPVYVQVVVEGFLCDQLQHSPRDVLRISYDGPHAAVIPLAQTDVPQSILQGLHPGHKQLLRDELRKRLDTAAVVEVMGSIQAALDENFESFMLSVAGLPKGELAAMAETLVATTSFMRKHSLDLESVGGVVDVAVITKRDGFVWIKRKRYFDATISANIE